jgi:hypothetical protein
MRVRIRQHGGLFSSIIVSTMGGQRSKLGKEIIVRDHDYKEGQQTLSNCQYVFVLIVHVVVTLVAHIPSLSQAALSHICANASKEPASQLVVLLFPPVFAHIPALRTASTQSTVQETVFISSECCTGSWTFATKVKTLYSSGTSSLRYVYAFSRTSDAAGCIGRGGRLALVGGH